MAQLAIKGHNIRGNEVIKILEMLGGENLYNKSCSNDSLFYYISDENRICELPISESYRDFVLFTLEEFLEKFPYKVGESVSSKYLKNYKIEKAEWQSCNNKVIYKLQGMGWYSVGELELYKEETMDKVSKAVFDANDQCCDIMNRLIKEETMEEKDEKSANHVFDTEIISFDIAQRDKYELDLQGKFRVVLREGKYYVERIKPRYPKTYEECCKVLFPNSIELGKVLTSGYNCEKLKKFGELLICRDAYWKITGDWKPNLGENFIYAIGTCYGIIEKRMVTGGSGILLFPTEEMRDAFYDNFKELIESCKELL